MTRKVFLAMPVYSQEIDFKTVMSLMYAITDSEQMGFKLQVVFRAGDALIVKARNVLINEFFQLSDATDIFFVDADLAWEPGAFGRMVMHPVDFVCACYRVKSETVNFFVRPLNGRFVRDPITGLMEIECAPTGFMRVSRRAVEDMIRVGGPDMWFEDHAAPHLQKIWTIFDTTFKDHKLWGEDYMFCSRYRDAGGKIWVDPEIALTHTGKTGYGGRFMDALNAMAVQQRNQQIQATMPVQDMVAIMNERYNGKLVRQVEALIAEAEHAASVGHSSLHA
jgi:hypothetical protein